MALAAANAHYILRNVFLKSFYPNRCLFHINKSNRYLKNIAFLFLGHTKCVKVETERQ